MSEVNDEAIGDQGGMVSRLMVPVELMTSVEADSLSEELRDAGLPSVVQRSHGLVTRSSAAQEVWLALSDPAVQILLGAAGSALWDGVVAVLGRRIASKGVRCVVAVRGGGRTIKVVVNGSMGDVQAALKSIPDVLGSESRQGIEATKDGGS
ncbi:MULTISPECIES: hypothetical protein [unclassified Modestobacter]|uniref:hypothetical protein n=1 Tax=unclassified Modestobacter TaxID=2643866 RepID=UPI0022AA72B6|nr:MULTISPECIES: hypothetical protein [unclassified Modestobacter]MCZ2824601.1 hypothetical protein [Modestobacter sp. VKM Ac-2981]MCZ2853871.1 hypothetical protein [Modestobacter sp. VKM Ac-2982]